MTWFDILFLKIIYKNFQKLRIAFFMTLSFIVIFLLHSLFTEQANSEVAFFSIKSQLSHHLQLKYNSKVPSLQINNVAKKRKDVEDTIDDNIDVIICEIQPYNIWLVKVFQHHILIELVEEGVRLSLKDNIWLLTNRRFIDLIVRVDELIIPNESSNKMKGQNKITAEFTNICIQQDSRSLFH